MRKPCPCWNVGTTERLWFSNIILFVAGEDGEDGENGEDCEDCENGEDCETVRMVRMARMARMARMVRMVYRYLFRDFLHGSVFGQNI